VTNGWPPAFRAEMFPFAISLSATFSNSASAKNHLSVAFSRSRSLSRRPAGPNGSLPRAAYRKYLWRKPAPTIFSTTRFSYAAAETAIERPGPHCVPVAGRIEALLQVEGLSNSG
jgi:hypothetical protein